jgi:hypothetical protein
MTIGRGLTGLVIFAAVGLATSSPAWAEEMKGRYMAQEAGDPAAAWTFTPAATDAPTSYSLTAEPRKPPWTAANGEWTNSTTPPQSNAPPTAPRIPAPRITPGTQSLWPAKCGPPTIAEPAGRYPEPTQPECHSI